MTGGLPAERGSAAWPTSEETSCSAPVTESLCRWPSPSSTAWTRPEELETIPQGPQERLAAG